MISINASPKPLSHWLDTLPAQLSAWQRESLHGKFKQWFNSVEHLPTLTPTRLDLLHGVRAEMEPGLSPGQLEGIERMLRTLMPWRKGPSRCMASISIPNGIPTGSGIACCRTFLRWPAAPFSTSAAAAVITCGA